MLIWMNDYLWVALFLFSNIEVKTYLSDFICLILATTIMIQINNYLQAALFFHWYFWSKNFLNDFILLILRTSMLIWMNNYQTLVNDFSLICYLISFFLNPIFPYPGSESIVMLFLISIWFACFIDIFSKSFLFSAQVKHP